MFNKKFLSTIVPVGCGVLAIIFATFLRGAVHKAEVLGETYHTFVRMFGVIFGGGSVVNTALNTSTSFDGGMSIFGLFAFIVVVAGLVVLVHIGNNSREATNAHCACQYRAIEVGIVCCSVLVNCA